MVRRKENTLFVGSHAASSSCLKRSRRFVLLLVHSLRCVYLCIHSFYDDSHFLAALVQSRDHVRGVGVSVFSFRFLHTDRSTSHFDCFASWWVHSANCCRRSAHRDFYNSQFVARSAARHVLRMFLCPSILLEGMTVNYLGRAASQQAQPPSRRKFQLRPPESPIFWI
jgi:hypothetical protein